MFDLLEFRNGGRWRRTQTLVRIDSKFIITFQWREREIETYVNTHGPQATHLPVRSSFFSISRSSLFPRSESESQTKRNVVKHHAELTCGRMRRKGNNIPWEYVCTEEIEWSAELTITQMKLSICVCTPTRHSVWRRSVGNNCVFESSVVKRL